MADSLTSNDVKKTIEEQDRLLIWQTIDTSIAKIMASLECRQAALYDFVGRDNSQVLVLEIEPYLKRHGLYRDLVQLYASNEMHVEALELIWDLWHNSKEKKLQKPASGWGVLGNSSPQTSDALADYLREMPVVDHVVDNQFLTATRLIRREDKSLPIIDHDMQLLPLFFEYASKLTKEPTVLLNVLTERDEALDAVVVLQWLKLECLTQAVPYLEIELSRDLARSTQRLSSELHNELGLLYVNAALREQAKKTEVHNDIRNRLQLFLRSSTRYSPERLLMAFKPQDLLEVSLIWYRRCWAVVV